MISEIISFKLKKNQEQETIGAVRNSCTSCAKIVNEKKYLYDLTKTLRQEISHSYDNILHSRELKIYFVFYPQIFSYKQLVIRILCI